MDEFLRLNVEQINRIARGGKARYDDLEHIIAAMPAPCTPSRAATLTGANHESELAAELFRVRVEVTA